MATKGPRLTYNAMPSMVILAYKALRASSLLQPFGLGSPAVSRQGDAE